MFSHSALQVESHLAACQLKGSSIPDLLTLKTTYDVCHSCSADGSSVVAEVILHSWISHLCNQPKNRIKQKLQGNHTTHKPIKLPFVQKKYIKKNTGLIKLWNIINSVNFSKSRHAKYITINFRRQNSSIKFV